MQTLFLDDTLLMFDKPAGLLCVPGKGADKQDCLSSRVQAIWPEALVVHRLDQATSGLVVMARTPLAQRVLSAAFAERQVRKTYVAVVHGHPASITADAEGWSEIDLPIAADWPRRPMRVIDTVNGKSALTRWRLDASATTAPPGQSRLILEPRTGRTHQLRVHMQAIGHPIVGDALYGPADDPALRLLLHATAIALPHPITGIQLVVESPAPF